MRMNKQTIGMNAGILWNLLSQQERWEYNELKARSGLHDRDLNAAIGWLAREDKIQFETDETNHHEYLYLAINYFIG